MDDTASKRRRGLGVVTPNACTECRKKRAKVGILTPEVKSPADSLKVRWPQSMREMRLPKKYTMCLRAACASIEGEHAP